MKFRNKKTGQIIEVNGGQAYVHCGDIAIVFRSLAELNEKLEDYEEPKLKNYYWISPLEGGVSCDEDTDDAVDKLNKEIGNYFCTREEAEKAVEKLKAFANLRKRGFKFNGWTDADRGIVGEFEIYCDALELDGIEQELEAVFGREEV